MILTFHAFFFSLFFFSNKKLQFLFSVCYSLYFRYQLKPYQLIGLKWLLLLHEHKLSGILADEMVREPSWNLWENYWLVLILSPTSKTNLRPQTFNEPSRTAGFYSMFHSKSPLECYCVRIKECFAWMCILQVNKQSEHTRKKKEMAENNTFVVVFLAPR